VTASFFVWWRTSRGEIDFMQLIDAPELCKMLGLPLERKEIAESEKAKGKKAPVPSGLQRAYRMASEPTKFGLLPGTVVKVGRQVRFRRDLIERWIEQGGTRRDAS
jgi:hypothetical protein